MPISKFILNRYEFAPKETLWLGNEEMMRKKDGEMGRWGDGEMGRWGDEEMRR
ncbi:MAG: hypothetical protein IPH84_17425 [Bacteroidales bacterium]|nr:hypothetical protein [Bacteroidales bacterium]